MNCPTALRTFSATTPLPLVEAGAQTLGEDLRPCSLFSVLHPPHPSIRGSLTFCGLSVTVKDSCTMDTRVFVSRSDYKAIRAASRAGKISMKFEKQATVDGTMYSCAPKNSMAHRVAREYFIS